ncbi:tRNA pseudouridine synthase A [Nitzschia inconspicua]|uniref:tRNA pseudouridine synthase n=1 Tax=Nitzschia inconspicua TaxID=303405 RepID=A0A9K3M8S4_9STRA|nr:tRNA pseudouridine synthase A [Nitzschia inconspicua]
MLASRLRFVRCCVAIGVYFLVLAEEISSFQTCRFIVLLRSKGRCHHSTAFKSEVEHSSVDENQQNTPGEVLTSAVLRISIDGSRFTGWSAANGQLINSRTVKSTRRSRRRRQRGSQQPTENSPGFVRSVEGVLRENLAKLWGNVDASRIVVEGCSRTDRGVHATGMMAQIYCLQENAVINQEMNDGPTIPGKQTPHPISSTDASSFLPLPMNGNLSKMAFSLNRMRPSDVQITGISPTPSMETGVFHASLSSVSKTYLYRISTGHVYDPTRKHTVWHVTERSSQSSLDLDKMHEACTLLQGTHDFVAFRGAPRGEHDKRRYANQNTVCTLSSIRIQEAFDPMMAENCYFVGADPPLQHFTFEVTGDRFLYRMVRMLVGAIVAVGLNHLDLSDLSRALELGSWDIPNNEQGRRKHFMCAPAHALVLQRVEYGDAITFDWQPLRDAKS